MKLTGKKVVLIDGSGYIFRAFYALPPMTRPSDGTPVNAVYGFCAMMMKLLREMPADYLAVVFDAARKTFRQDIYPAYKATRRETPEDLIPQFPLLRRAVDAFNIAQTEENGYEADDLLATYARLAREAGAAVTVVSADKDLMQLVGGGTVVFDPMKNRVVGEEQVFEKFGVSPDKVVEVQSLTGDSVDNVPGVPGIGPKTAAQLITEYGTLENLLAHASDIKQEKRRQALIDNDELARISKRLVTLNDHAPVLKKLEDFAVKSPDETVLTDFMTEMGFRSLVPKIKSFLSANEKQVEDRPVESAVHSVKTTIVRTKENLANVAEKAVESGLLALSVPEDDLPPPKRIPVGLALSFAAGEAFYVPFGRSEKKQISLFDAPAPSEEKLSAAEVLSLLRPVFENAGVLKIGHDIKSVWHALSNVGPVSMEPVTDTRVMAYDLDGTAFPSDENNVAERYLTTVLPEFQTVLKQEKLKSPKDLSDETVADVIGRRVEAVFRLYPLLRGRLLEEKRTELYEKLDRPAVSVLYRMERAGIKVDVAALSSMSAEFGSKMAEVENRICEEAGEHFNVNSPSQIGRILFEKMNLSGGKKSKTGTFSTDVKVLETLAEQGVQIADDILTYRQFAKLKSTYTDALQNQINPATGRVHTTFMQTGTLTGRLSSADPNLQNIPVRSEEGRMIRRAFTAEKGKLLLSADYSQIELRLMAHVADVRHLKEAFARGIDIHAATASHVFGVPVEGMDPMIRRRAKAINFGIIYGISAFGLARQIGVERREAQAYIDAYFEKYPEIKAYMERTVAFVRRHGYVETPFGRRCPIPTINDKNAAIRQYAERSAINAPIQGGAADILKKAMVRMPAALTEAGLNAVMILQVHDELIFETPENEAERLKETVRNVMENAVSLTVPLIAEAGIAFSWADAH